MPEVRVVSRLVVFSDVSPRVDPFERAVSADQMIQSTHDTSKFRPFY